MERQVLHVFAGDLRHPAGPPAVAPGDEPDGRVRPPHRSGELDGLACCGLEVEAVPVVRSLVADLPVTDVVRPRRAVSPAFGIVRGVAVRDPLGRFPRVTGADARSKLHVLPPPVRLEVDAHQWLGANLTAEADELPGAHLVRFDSAPEQIDERLTTARWADAFAPAVVVGKYPAPPHHRWPEVLRHLD